MMLEYKFCIQFNVLIMFPLSRRKRDEGNMLLLADINKIVQEECKTNSRMDQVRQGAKRNSDTRMMQYFRW